MEKDNRYYKVPAFMLEAVLYGLEAHEQLLTKELSETYYIKETLRRLTKQEEINITQEVAKEVQTIPRPFSFARFTNDERLTPYLSQQATAPKAKTTKQEAKEYSKEAKEEAQKPLEKTPLPSPLAAPEVKPIADEEIKVAILKAINAGTARQSIKELVEKMGALRATNIPQEKRALFLQELEALMVEPDKLLDA